MTIVDLGRYLVIAAAVIGFIVMAFLIMVGVWLLQGAHESWAYKRSRKRKHEMEWDNIRSAWIDQYIPIQRKQPSRADTLEMYAVSPDQVNTDIMNHTLEQIESYQREHYQ